MISARVLTRKQNLRARDKKRAGAVHPACCDRCQDKRNTLFDLPEGLLCLLCAFRIYDETKRSHVNLLIRAAVAGTINIERRRRVIAKRRAAA